MMKIFYLLTIIALVFCNQNFTSERDIRLYNSKQDPNELLLKGFRYYYNEGIVMINEALRLGANPDINNEFGETVLNTAIRKKEIAYIEALLKAGVNIHRTHETQNTTSLMTAVMMNFPDLVKRFIKQGAKLNETDYLGRSALYYVFFNISINIAERIKMMEILLDAGAIPDEKFIKVLNETNNEELRKAFDRYNIIKKLKEFNPWFKSPPGIGKIIADYAY